MNVVFFICNVGRKLSLLVVRGVEAKGGGDVCKLGEGTQFLIESRGQLEAGEGPRYQPRVSKHIIDEMFIVQCKVERIVLR